MTIKRRWLFNLDSLAVFVFICLLLDISASKINVNCGGCKLLIQELEHSISQTDPKKTVKVGSFRVDPQGNQYLSDIPFARSEGHLHELLEHVCDASKHYGIAEHPATGRSTFVRTENFQGQKLKFSSLEDSNALKSKLKFACESILEDHEDELLKILSKENHDTLNQFCHKQTGLCNVEDFIPYPEEIESEELEVQTEDTEPEDPDDEKDIHEL